MMTSLCASGEIHQETPGFSNLEDGVLWQGTTSKGTFATVDGSEIRRSPHGMVLKPCK